MRSDNEQKSIWHGLTPSRFILYLLTLYALGCVALYLYPDIWQEAHQWQKSTGR